MPVQFSVTASLPMTAEDQETLQRVVAALSAESPRSVSVVRPLSDIPANSSSTVEAELKQAITNSYGGRLLRGVAEFVKAEGRPPTGAELKARIGTTSGLVRSLNAYFKRSGAARFFTNPYTADSATPVYILEPAYVDAILHFLTEDGTWA